MVHSAWITPKIFGIAFKILQYTGMQLESLVHRGVHIQFASAGVSMHLTMQGELEW